MNKNRVLRNAAISILVGLLVGAVIILILGKNPLTAYFNLLQGCGLAPKGKYAAGRGMLTDLCSYIDFLTPMIFAALAVAVAMKAGLFNIGVAGQMLAAGFIATITIGYSAIPAGLAKPLVLLIGAAVGAALGAIVGFLKYRFNINEVVSTIMFNYIVSYVVSFFINTRYVDAVSRQSRNIGENARLTLQNVLIAGYKFNIPLGFIVALVAVFVVKFVMDRTVLGFELKAVGLNNTAARYAGIAVGRSIVLSMVISGALAGLAGVTYYLGYFASIQPRVLVSTGYDAIAVCLVGNSNPFGILASTLLLQIISKGSTYMSSQSGLESEIASVITAIILLSTTISVLYMELFGKLRSKKGGKTA
ncbi:MAG: ABC transporter permease [Lachnospiraceae bacterium]|nr:ABC transporter permease [Lachnospiraceae bacterium]